MLGVDRNIIHIVHSDPSAPASELTVSDLEAVLSQREELLAALEELLACNDLEITARRTNARVAAKVAIAEAKGQ